MDKRNLTIFPQMAHGNLVKNEGCPHPRLSALRKLRRAHWRLHCEMKASSERCHPDVMQIRQTKTTCRAARRNL